MIPMTTLPPQLEPMKEEEKEPSSNDDGDDKQTQLQQQTPHNNNNTIIMTTMAIACFTTTVVSVSMILLNKAIVLSIIPFGGGLVLIQNSATVLLVQAYRWGSGPEDFGISAVLYNTPCAILFGMNTFTSIQALAFLSVTTFTIFRNTQSILSAPLDYLIRGERLKPVSIFFLCTILLGTCAYCGKDLRANVEGIAWASAHLASTTLYTVLTKIRLEKKNALSSENLKKKPINNNNPLTQALDLAWYNNILSLPIVGAAAAFQAVFLMKDTPFVRSECGLYCWMMVAASCFNGCAMSVVGLKTQSLMTPTSFLTFNNLNKIPAMLISAAIWPHLETANTTPEIMGVVLSILGGYLYALSKQEGDVHPAAIFVSVVMCIALVPMMILGEEAFEQQTGLKLLLLFANSTKNISTP